jgi:hypothetical protein
LWVDPSDHSDSQKNQGEFIPAILTSDFYGPKLPGEDGEPYTHVKGRIFFK